ncbi:phosphotransferase [Arthrobacter sp. zg-Y877]|uniref:phosphotransferase n=1 Tax=Arthrobacter sp. zg-Y877 TaxID=3049074 RepID=UPI0025A4BD77|nr:phosphotransferase [Arthrobacter sp. zg-Y877]MDM7989384.1 phosphotransferase [Arthrobacter sp. zg-Y877]
MQIIPDYRRTARRRSWSDLPPVLQETFCTRLGGRITSVEPAGGGFTPGFAAVLVSDAGARVFAKAAPASDTVIYPSYLRESQVVPLMPAGMPMPALQATESLVADGIAWQLLIYEAVDGYMPGHPWTQADLAAVEAACSAAARLLAGFPRAAAGTPVADDMTGVPTCFAPVAGGGPAPWFLPDLTTSEARMFQELLELCPEALAGDSVIHGDLRPDNILISSGRALICDWNFLGTGAPWLDWVGVLPYVRADGFDVDAELQRSLLTRDVPARHIDAWLAALLNYMIDSGNKPEVPSSPHLRSHGRHTARLIYAWLVSRLGLRG